jgi:hypothetical protein
VQWRDAAAIVNRWAFIARNQDLRIEGSAKKGYIIYGGLPHQKCELRIEECEKPGCAVIADIKEILRDK